MIRPRLSYHWLVPHQAPFEQPKRPLHQRNIILDVWWNAQGIVYRELLSPSQTMNEAVYSQLLVCVIDKLKTVDGRSVILLREAHMPGCTYCPGQLLSSIPFPTLSRPESEKLKSHK